MQRVLEGLESSKSRWQQTVREIEHKISHEEVTGCDSTTHTIPTYIVFPAPKARLRSVDTEIRREDHELQSKMAEDQDESPPALAVLEELRQVFYLQWHDRSNTLD